MARHGVEAASGAAAALPPDIPGWDPQDLNTAPRIVMETIQHLRAGEDDAQDRTWVHRRMAILAGQKKSPLYESVEVDPLTIYSSGDRVSYSDAAAIIEDADDDEEEDLAQMTVEELASGTSKMHATFKPVLPPEEERAPVSS